MGRARERGRRGGVAERARHGGGGRVRRLLPSRERLFRALYFVTASREDAEELMQDAFLKLWERWDRIERIDDPTAYLFRVALNAFRSRVRRTRGRHRRNERSDADR
jgi:RNA polymerase sigma factor (sigma-70 family)